MSKLINILTIFIVVGLAITPDKTDAQVIDPRYESVFIYQFTKYIEWPEESKQSDFVIAVVGKGDIINELYKLAETKTVDGKTIVIKLIKDVNQATGAEILFISNSHSSYIKDAVATLKQKPVLIISESSGGAELGASINFILINNRIKFEINRNSANQANLKIRSSLLKLAKVIG